MSSLIHRLQVVQCCTTSHQSISRRTGCEVCLVYVGRSVAELRSKQQRPWGSPLFTTWHGVVANSRLTLLSCDRRTCDTEWSLENGWHVFSSGRKLNSLTLVENTSLSLNNTWTSHLTVRFDFWDRTRTGAELGLEKSHTLVFHHVSATLTVRCLFLINCYDFVMIWNSMVRLVFK